MAAILIAGLIACLPAARVQVGKQQGQCTEVDLQVMNEAGPGSRKGSFPHLSRDCGMATWTMLRPFHFDQPTYIECAKERIGLTTPCASCFANYSSYGFGHCWKQCLTNWCSSKCLTCVATDLPSLESCVGATTPMPEACDGHEQEIDPEEDTDITTTSEKNSDSSSEVAGGSDAGADETPTVDSTTTTTTADEFTGACSAADKELMDKAGPGHDKGTWGKICSDCGTSSFSVFRMRMDEKAYVQCLKSKIPVSESCAGCFAGSATYGASTCWSSCMGSWCSKGCLMCVNGYMSKLESCIGFTPPAASACDGSGYRPGVDHHDHSPDSDGNHSDGSDSVHEGPPSPPPSGKVTDDDQHDRPPASDGGHSGAGDNDHEAVDPDNAGDDRGTVSLISVSPSMAIVYSVVVAILAGLCGFCCAKTSGE